MTFYIEDYFASPLRDCEKLEDNFSIDNNFSSFVKELSDSGLDGSLVEEIKICGFYSSFFQKAFLSSMGYFDCLETAEDLLLKADQKSFDYIIEKNVSSFDELKIFLFKAVRKELARIAFRDITGKANLLETLKALSFLADSAVKKAVFFLHDDLKKIFGTPLDESGQEQKLLSVAMGKLGAYELNFSSDIDLIFVYPKNGETDGIKSISTEEFFIRLVRKFGALFKGAVPGEDTYIIDLRLRPFGNSGPLVMSIKAVEHYYQTQGREWERYALIKARCITGNKSDIKKFYESIAPFVFRRYLDYGAFDSMRDMKSKIIFEIKRKNNEDNIKNGSGGIREIEFFGQIFQLIRGGIDKRFREKGIINILRLLGSENMIPGQTAAGLEDAYVFLRVVENRIQQLEGRQTHNLPLNDDALKKIAFSLGFSSAEEFRHFVGEKRKYVHSHFMGVLRDESESGEEDELFYFKMLWDSPEEYGARSSGSLEEIGSHSGSKLFGLFGSFKKEVLSSRITPDTLARIDRLMPFLIREMIEADIDYEAANRIMGLVSAIIKKSCYISLLFENPAAVYHLVKLFKESSWVGNYLKNHPVLLDELLDSRTLYYPPEKDELAVILDSRISGVYFEDTERLLETICIFRQSMILRVASAEISGQYPLMKISDRLTELAEVIIERVLQKAWVELVEKYGYPVDESGEILLNPGIAVIAYGKLGGIELGYGSDLDLVFVHNDVKGLTCGKRSIPCVQFYAKLAQKMLSYLSIRTAAGKMYEIDLRLRPGGNSGVIILAFSSFADYFYSRAWTFEHQAFVKARIIFSHEKIEREFFELRKKILCMKRDEKTLKSEIRDMRKKVLMAHGSAKNDVFHLKYDEGAMMDIEFLVQYLVLKNSHENTKLVAFTDIVRILSTLEREKILSRNEASFLRFAYLVYRSMGHKLDLIEKKPVLDAGRFASLREGVSRLWKSYLE
ncbi:MAG: bifunctional [glutamate--ammonia ligase]-adenylyl-L-tyrosine phosphorylase/[glutamate--ammonia-ligase] adenylyltransferase [Desulfobacteraceae bacterium]|nr:bifunctional [glutamate--ammonia ligase]-adenylyl-L-tyrosine phosphorylase/[glutamate--ammonia-ligase] adenylyltransferase [Desulfobacteraceae bacterium]MCB9495030.1 bifunctional [glutamate--ammonia ligase]-adenylyl-L-tyrosine phosphorylase/[glutamate--ammonia-ligase] adenylyltransferase [Desulfobacteraceae bacterium]